MKAFMLLTVLVFGALQSVPQENKGVIEGRVTRPDSPDGIPSVQITLQGPSPILAGETLPGYTPNPSLTSDMRAQIDALIASAPPGINPDVVGNAANRMQLQLLGLPLPEGLNQPTQNNAPPQTSMLSDATGKFTFRNLAPGRYRLTAQREGFFGEAPRGARGVSGPTAVNTVVTLSAADPTQEVIVTMLQGATISGRVRDPNGQPLTGITVNAFQIVYQNPSGRRILQSANAKTTDDRGEFRLFWLAPGEYYVAASPRRPNNIPNPQDSYARTFYPGATDVRTIQPLTIREGSETQAIDIGFRAGATGKISGRVNIPFTGPNGQPLQAGTFFLLPVDTGAITENNLNFPNSAQDRSNGKFEIRGVPPGSYDLVTMVSESGVNRQWTGRTRVHAGGDVENVIMELQPGVEVKVRLTVDGAAPAYTMNTNTPRPAADVILPPTAVPAVPTPVPSIRVQLVPKEASTQPFNNANQNMAYDPAGISTFPSVPRGRYMVQMASLPANAYVRDIHMGGSPVFDDGFEIDGTASEIQVTVNSKGAKIEGSVLDAQQKPGASVLVTLVPIQSRRQNPMLYKTATTSANGTFTINGVAPGEYRLFAWERIPNLAWLNPEFLAQYEEHGQNVLVEVDRPNQIQLKIVPKPEGQP